MTHQFDPVQPRRRFLGRAAAALAALTTGVSSVAFASDSAGTASDHDAWMSPLKGKHRQFFHALDANDRAMLMASNYLDAYHDEFGAKAGEVNAVIGMHGPALWIGFNDAAWARYGFGKSTSVIDPVTKEASLRNTFARGGALSVETLQKRGVVFLMCNTALRQRSRGLAAERRDTYETVYEDLKASRLPGVLLVPAMVVAINRAQEAGFSYVRV